jgi:malyl-CoA/(S)-citramalyl-CoA lyase
MEDLMKPPRQFFVLLAVGAPAPLRELPVLLERMIHFVPPHNEKVRTKRPSIAASRFGARQSRTPFRLEAKEDARKGFIEMANKARFRVTGLWTRINALEFALGADDDDRGSSALWRQTP